VLDDADVGRAVFGGVSIGGYIPFEFWRRYRGRVAGLALCCTRAQADLAEGRAGRLKTADDVLERGTEPFIDSMIPRVFSRTTLTMRPDLVEQARRMMLKMSPADIAQVQRGMAERPDLIPTLATINVPTLLVMGEEDTSAPFADGELMRQHIPGSQLKLIPKAGHFAVWKQLESVSKLLRQFVDSCH
jgi:3-oxoadipate enol-lactonase